MPMKKTIDIEAKDVQAAVAQALEQLGVTRDKTEIKILREEKKGLFGMKGAHQAKVRVTVKDPP